MRYPVYSKANYTNILKPFIDKIMSEEKPQVEGEVPAEGAEEQVNIYTTVVQI